MARNLQRDKRWKVAGAVVEVINFIVQTVTDFAIGAFVTGAVVAGCLVILAGIVGAMRKLWF